MTKNPSRDRNGTGAKESMTARTQGWKAQTQAVPGSAARPKEPTPWERQRRRDEMESAAIERAITLSASGAAHPMDLRRR
jgi:hypothetical protein